MQRETLRAFFRNERGFYLTGGAALAGFHLRHRETNDLDFFTPDEDAFERGRHALEAAAESVGAALAFVLSQVRIPEGIELPGAVRPAELRTYVEDLVRRLRRAAAPA